MGGIGKFYASFQQNQSILCIYIYVYIFIYLFLSIYLFIYLSVCLSIYLPAYLFFYLLYKLYISLHPYQTKSIATTKVCACTERNTRANAKSTVVSSQQTWMENWLQAPNLTSVWFVPLADLHACLLRCSFVHDLLWHQICDWIEIGLYWIRLAPITSCPWLALSCIDSSLSRESITSCSIMIGWSIMTKL